MVSNDKSESMEKMEKLEKLDAAYGGTARMDAVSWAACRFVVKVIIQTELSAAERRTRRSTSRCLTAGRWPCVTSTA
jgi:hypothetical protein